MKINIILFTLLGTMIGGGAFAQVEQDDMYFNAKDRVKLRESQKSAEIAMASARKKAQREEDELNNPKDTYSARNVNPEYTSRSHSKEAQEDEQDYYVNNYRYNQAEQYNNWNNNFNNWYGNSWYRNNYWGPSINAWNTPYYGYYDSFNSPWYDPYWSQNGWSSSFSFYYGNSWNYGWGGNYNYWNRPYCPGWNSYYSNAYWNYYRYPSTIIVINNSESAGRGVAYGKRPTRGSSFVSERETRTRSTVVSGPNGRQTDNSGGRARTQSEYYDRSWRNSDTNTTQPASYDSRTSTQYNRPNSNWSNSNNSNWSNSNNSSGRTYSAPTQSSPTRSHSSSSGSGSNGRTRGRD